MSASRLFQPLQVGRMQLSHRVAMAPLTRSRNDDDHVPMLDLMTEYYAQRAAVPGTLLVSEATLIAQRIGSYPNVPGIYNQKQIDHWKVITEAVHKKGSYIYLQLWHVGRTADPVQTAKDGGRIVSSSATPLQEDSPVPAALMIPEIKELTEQFAEAAKNAIAAGFDGVEIHGANGYLVDQFIQDTVNHRTDDYGGSIENRSRFAIEVTQAVVDAVGADRTAIRLSPYSDFQGMKMADPNPQFIDVLDKLNKLNISYVHLVESRASLVGPEIENPEDMAPLLEHFDGPTLLAGGYNAENATATIDTKYKNKNVVVVFGRWFISTPDIVFRLQNGIAFNPYDRNTFYAPKTPNGYIDYPFSKEFEAAQVEAKA